MAFFKLIHLDYAFSPGTGILVSLHIVGSRYVSIIHAVISAGIYLGIYTGIYTNMCTYVLRDNSSLIDTQVCNLP